MVQLSSGQVPAACLRDTHQRSGKKKERKKGKQRKAESGSFSRSPVHARGPLGSSVAWEVTSAALSLPPLFCSSRLKRLIVTTLTANFEHLFSIAVLGTRSFAPSMSSPDPPQKLLVIGLCGEPIFVDWNHQDTVKLIKDRAFAAASSMTLADGSHHPCNLVKGVFSER